MDPLDLFELHPDGGPFTTGEIDARGQHEHGFYAEVLCPFPILPTHSWSVYLSESEDSIRGTAPSLREAAEACLEAIRERFGWTEAQLVEYITTLREMNAINGKVPWYERGPGQ